MLRFVLALVLAFSGASSADAFGRKPDFQRVFACFEEMKANNIHVCARAIRRPCFKWRQSVKQDLYASCLREISWHWEQRVLRTKKKIAESAADEEFETVERLADQIFIDAEKHCRVAGNYTERNSYYRERIYRDICKSFRNSFVVYYLENGREPAS